MNTRLIFLPAAGGEAWATVIDAAGRVLRSGAWPEGDDGDVQRTVIAVPGAQALARWVDLPARTEAQARSAAAFLLEDEIAAPRDTSHIALGPVDAAGRRLVVVVDRTEMRGWLDAAAAAGLKPDVLIPDHLLLAPPEDGAALGVRIGPMLAVRAEGLALTSEPDLAPLIVGERRLALVEEPDEAQAAFAAGAAAPVVNLLQGEFATKRERALDRKAVRGPLLLAAAVLVLPLATQAVTLIRHSAGAEIARQEARALAVEILPPDLARSPDPLRAALDRATALEAVGAGGFTAPAAALFAAIEQAQTTELVRLQYTPAGELRATVSYVEYADVETMRTALGRSGFILAEGGSTTADGRTVTELTVRAGG